MTIWHNGNHEKKQGQFVITVTMRKIQGQCVITVTMRKNKDNLS